jgi:uncharacterized membrane protein YesL
MNTNIGVIFVPTVLFIRKKQAIESEHLPIWQLALYIYPKRFLRINIQGERLEGAPI